MEVGEIKEKLYQSFLNKGIIVDNDDAEIITYIADSVVFITVILEIESMLDIEFPDTLLNPDSLGTINTLSNTLQDLINSN